MSSRLAFQTQLASIMEVLANAAVAEICKLVDDDYAVVRLQMSQCQRENKALKRKLHLLELKMARGNAERRLRESALSSSRPRVHVSADDRLREPPPAGGVYERQIDVALWSSRASAADATRQPLRSDSVQSKSPDVELVEPEAVLVKEEKMESNMSRAEEVENDVALIGDDGVLECVPRGLTGQRANEQQGNQMQTGRARRPSSRSSRGVEREEEPDVVLVKVEEMESVRAAQNETGLSIQEGLVESSTDDYRGVLPFEESTQSSSQRCDLQDPSRAFSEVSYGHSSLWTNRGGSYCRNDSLAGPSSHSNPPLCAEAQHGSSGRALAAETVESSRGFHTSVTFEQQPTVIDLSEEPVPVQASGQVQGGLLSVQVPQHFLDPGPSQGQASYSSTHARQKMPRKRVYLCKFCSKGFTSPANLESHLRTHTGERPYGCNLCGKKFSQFWNLKIHRNTHTGERPYQCSLCPEKFSDPSNLKKHQKRHHSQLYANSEGCLNQPHPAAGISESSSAPVQLGTADSNSPANPKTQEQQGCGNLNPLTSEYSLFELETFFTRWAPDDASAPSEASCSFTTDDSAKCNKDGGALAHTERCLSPAARRSTAQALSRPLRMQALSAPSPWRRTQGRMSAPSQQDHSSAAVTHSDGGDSAPALSLPCRKMNSGVAPPLSFGVALSAQHRDTLLARHNKTQAVSTMLNERRRKSYACQACGKAFSGLSNLEAHERVHTGEKPFRCDTCGKHFSEAGNLKKHQRVHTGEKPFSCDQCGKRFAWICNLRTHQQSATGCIPPARG